MSWSAASVLRRERPQIRRDPGAFARAQAGAVLDLLGLTADEIAALDMTGVEWAVLSACESGAGKVIAEEGVLGIRRALRAAGARTVIVSLWSVSDRDARSWVRELYQARLERRRDTVESVREASLALLRERRAAGASTHPGSWGAFVAIGEWR